MSINKEKMSKYVLPPYYESDDIESGRRDSKSNKIDYVAADLDNMEKGRSMLDLGEDSKAGGRRRKRSRKNKKQKKRMTKKGRKSKKMKRKTKRSRTFRRR